MNSEHEGSVVQRGSLFLRLRHFFTMGLIALAPVVITLAILRVALHATAAVLSPLIDSLAGDLHPAATTAISVIVLILLVFLAGVVASNAAGRWFFSLLDTLFLRLPIVRSVHLGVKQVISMFDTTQPRSFERVVWVRFPTAWTWSIGFVIGSIANQDRDDMIRVFLPTAPNPTSGFAVLVRPEDTIEAGIPVDVAVRMLVSGGIIAPDSVDIETGAQRSEEQIGE